MQTAAEGPGIMSAVRTREQRMYAFNIDKEQEWDPKKHVENIL